MLGPAHPLVLRSMNNLAWILGRLDRHIEAETMQRQVRCMGYCIPYVSHHFFADKRAPLYNLLQPLKKFLFKSLRSVGGVDLRGFSHMD
eukprot:1156520-Pelagomonas_calceolata.AAC.5